jgi:hypothetical protein
MARHLSHCQPCRRYARLAGVDLGTPVRPAAAATKIAAWFPLPLPLYLRRRWESDPAGQLVAHSSHGSVAQWSASLAGAVDPGTASGWSKAIATAATVAVAGVGAGAAIHEHRTIEKFVGGSPPAASHAAPHGAAQNGSRAARGHAPSAAKAAPDAAPGSRASAPAGATTLPAAPHGNAPSSTKLAGAKTQVASKLAPADGLSAAKGPGALTTLTEDAIAGAPSDAPAAVPEQPLGRILDVLGGSIAATDGTAGTSNASTAGTPPTVGGALAKAHDVVAGTLSAPATVPVPPKPIAASPLSGVTVPPAAPAAPAAAAGLTATVSTTVSSTLATTTATAAGRTAP